MDTNLETKLTSYNFLLVILFLFLIIAIVIYKVNYNTFSYSFGKEIFVTIPFLFIIIFLIKEIIVLKTTPSSSFLSKISFSNNQLFIPLLISLTFAIAVGGFFSVLAVAGIFDDKPPINNSSIILNIALIFLFIIISACLFFYSQQKDQPILNQIPFQIKNIYELRTKWTIIFAVFLLVITLLYLVNPAGVMTNYGGPVIFLSLFVSLVMFSMIYIYQYFLDNPSKSNMFSSAPTFFSFLLKGSYIIGALTLSGLMIYGVLKVMGLFDGSGSNYNSWTHYLINFILLGTLIGILYKLINSGGYLSKSPLYRLIVNTLLYIPCILVELLSILSSLLGLSSDSSSGFSPATPGEKRILIISLVLVLGYFLMEKLIIPRIKKRIVTQGGKQYINEPITLTSNYNVASYQELNDITEPDKYNYQYALSFWVYLDSFPPSTNSSYLKNVKILSLGDNPSIYYDGTLNTLSISVKQNSEPIYSYIKEHTDLSTKDIEKWKEVKITLDNNKLSHNSESIEENNNVETTEDNNDNNRILYKNNNVLLQKWNNIVLNYNGGTLDIFYNGTLVKSSIEVVPYLKYDMLTIGSDNGVSGNIANLVYFKNTLDAVTISNIYNTLKNKNPPIL